MLRGQKLLGSSGAFGTSRLRSLAQRSAPEDVPLDRFGLTKKIPPSVYRDNYFKHRQLIKLYPRVAPFVPEDAFVAPCATLVGKVELWPRSSVWYNCVIASDRQNGLIRIGGDTNIQDGTVIVEASEPVGPDHDGSTIIGSRVTVGHRCYLRGCTIEPLCLVGMGSVLMEGSYMETLSILGAGSVLRPGQRVPTHQLWLGNPARYVRDLTEEEIEGIAKSADKYVIIADKHRDEFQLPNYVWKDAEDQGIEVHLSLYLSLVSFSAFFSFIRLSCVLLFSFLILSLLRSFSLSLSHSLNNPKNTLKVGYKLDIDQSVATAHFEEQEVVYTEQYQWAGKKFGGTFDSQLTETHLNALQEFERQKKLEAGLLPEDEKKETSRT
ncbi:Bacterial transferase hexapeptide repeat-containing protein [Balamuthia mandrillaris]